MSLSARLRRLNTRLNPGYLFYNPEWLVLGVNNICNLHCKMCDVGVGNTNSTFAKNLTGTSPLNMPEELIFKILDEAARWFPEVKIGYAFTEPLVYPHLESSLKHAKGKGLFTSITTNALALPQKAAMLCESGLNEIYISLDGPKDIHNFIRGNDKSFQKALEGIEKLYSHPNPPLVSVFCTLTEWNVQVLEEFAEGFKNFPLKQVGFMHTNFTPQWLAEKHNMQYGDRYKATLSNTLEMNPENINIHLLRQTIQKLKSTKYPYSLTFSPDLSTEDELHTFYYKPEIPIGKICNDAYRNIMIKSDGSVIPAHGRCFNYTFGNLYQQSLKEIWNSKEASKFRRDLMQAGGLFPACTRCCSAF